jgi:hypothetical protein
MSGLAWPWLPAVLLLAGPLGVDAKTPASAGTPEILAAQRARAVRGSNGDAIEPNDPTTHVLLLLRVTGLPGKAYDAIPVGDHGGYWDAVRMEPTLSVKCQGVSLPIAATFKEPRSPNSKVYLVALLPLGTVDLTLQAAGAAPVAFTATATIVESLTYPVGSPASTSPSASPSSEPSPKASLANYPGARHLCSQHVTMREKRPGRGERHIIWQAFASTKSFVDVAAFYGRVTEGASASDAAEFLVRDGDETLSVHPASGQYPDCGVKPRSDEKTVIIYSQLTRPAR